MRRRSTRRWAWVTVGMVAAAWFFVSAPASFAQTTCLGQVATMEGTEGDDILAGSLGNDVIAGLGGDDVINGSFGNDVICGEEGNDELIGSIGADKIDGGLGVDRLLGGDGPDILTGLFGADELFGGEGSDRVYGGEGNDLLEGADGSDLLKGEGDRDLITGGDGPDDVYGGEGLDRIVGGVGLDRLFGGDDRDIARGGRGDDYVEGAGGDDSLFGEPGETASPEAAVETDAPGVSVSTRRPAARPGSAFPNPDRGQSPLSAPPPSCRKRAQARREGSPRHGAVRVVLGKPCGPRPGVSPAAESPPIRWGRRYTRGAWTKGHASTERRPPSSRSAVSVSGLNAEATSAYPPAASRLTRPRYTSSRRIRARPSGWHPTRSASAGKVTPPARSPRPVCAGLGHAPAHACTCRDRSLEARLIPHRHCPRAELQPAHELQVDMRR